MKILKNILVKWIVVFLKILVMYVFWRLGIMVRDVVNEMESKFFMEIIEYKIDRV